MLSVRDRDISAKAMKDDTEEKTVQLLVISQCTRVPGSHYDGKRHLYSLDLIHISWTRYTSIQRRLESISQSTYIILAMFSGSVRPSILVRKSLFMVPLADRFFYQGSPCSGAHKLVLDRCNCSPRGSSFILWPFLMTVLLLLSLLRYSPVIFY